MKLCLIFYNSHTSVKFLFFDQPGTRSMQTLHGAPRVHQTKHSQDAKKDSSSSKN